MPLTRSPGLLLGESAPPLFQAVSSSLLLTSLECAGHEFCTKFAQNTIVIRGKNKELGVRDDLLDSESVSDRSALGQ